MPKGFVAARQVMSNERPSFQDSISDLWETNGAVMPRVPTVTPAKAGVQLKTSGSPPLVSGFVRNTLWFRGYLRREANVHRAGESANPGGHTRILACIMDRAATGFRRWSAASLRLGIRPRRA